MSDKNEQQGSSNFKSFRAATDARPTIAMTPVNKARGVITMTQAPNTQTLERARVPARMVPVQQQSQTQTPAPSQVNHPPANSDKK